jgi:hypothetical protein
MCSAGNGILVRCSGISAATGYLRKAHGEQKHGNGIVKTTFCTRPVSTVHLLEAEYTRGGKDCTHYNWSLGHVLFTVSEQLTTNALAPSGDDYIQTGVRYRMCSAGNGILVRCSDISAATGYLRKAHGGPKHDSGMAKATFCTRPVSTIHLLEAASTRGGRNCTNNIGSLGHVLFNVSEQLTITALARDSDISSRSFTFP